MSSSPTSPRKLVHYDTPLYNHSKAQAHSSLRPDEINGFVSDPDDLPKKSKYCNCFSKPKHHKMPTRIDIKGTDQKVSASSSNLGKS